MIQKIALSRHRFPPFVRLAGAALALALSSAVAAGQEATQDFAPAQGIADPSLAMNTAAYLKWGESTKAPMIDRMKGALAWNGKRPFVEEGTQGLHELEIPSDKGAAAPVITFTPQTILSLRRALIQARYNDGRISANRIAAIRKDYDAYFRIVPTLDGASRLEGRLDPDTPFLPLARFDVDVDMTVEQMRNQGRLVLDARDLQIPFETLDLDRQGWPRSLPLDLQGRTGTVSTFVLWYPKDSGQGPDSIYAGRYHLMAEGRGEISLSQVGKVDKGDKRLRIPDLRIDGPTHVTFDYVPNGSPVRLDILSSDPKGTGDYVRNLRIVHDRHMPMYEAGAAFAPEFVELLQDFRSVRWMAAMEATHNPPFAEGAFADRPLPDHYSFAQGSNGTPFTGLPIDLIVEFSNMTGTDPWIAIPVNASDDYIRGMAEHVARTLDPERRVLVEFGNENWNGIFKTNAYATKKALATWGELKLEMAPDGKIRRSFLSGPTLIKDGAFFDLATARRSGYDSLEALALALGLDHPLRATSAAWAEWSGMRATQAGRIFADAFARIDPAHGRERLSLVMATFTYWDGADDLLLKAELWRTMGPTPWEDPAALFDSLAVGIYFGGDVGGRNSDLTAWWLKTYGPETAMSLVLRNLSAGLDPALRLERFEAATFERGGRISADKVRKGVRYGPDLVIDLNDALAAVDPSFEARVGAAAGLKGDEILIGAAALDRVRLGRGPGGETTIEMRPDPQSAFQTALVFDGPVADDLPSMMRKGIVLVRSLKGLDQEARQRLDGRAAKAAAYGLDMIAYEGGQHIAAAIWGPFRANLRNDALSDLVRDINRTPQMGRLYDMWLDEWRREGGAMAALFLDYDTPSRFGAFGMLERLGQQHGPQGVPWKYRAIAELNAQPPWWREEARAPDAFLHGAVLRASGKGAVRGTRADDMLIGTAAAETLEGGPGDDRINGGGGADTLSGGEGDDALVLHGDTRTLDGGPGVNALHAAFGVKAIDLGDGRVRRISRVDLVNNVAVTLSVAAADVAAIAPDGRLTVRAGPSDRVNATGFDPEEPCDTAGPDCMMRRGIVAGREVVLLVLR
jgi:hypothetical protein